ncbi:SAM-dependent DNA methyltransferase, partial [Pseudomonas viridiflava]
MPDEEHFSELLAKIIKSLQRGIDALRGTVFSDRFTSILLPIFLFKRISDVFSEESSPQILETVIRPNSFRIPKGCSWHDLISESFDLNRT